MISIVSLGGISCSNWTQGCILTEDTLEYSCQTENVNFQARENAEVKNSLKSMMDEIGNCSNCSKFTCINIWKYMWHNFIMMMMISRSFREPNRGGAADNFAWTRMSATSGWVDTSICVSNFIFFRKTAKHQNELCIEPKSLSIWQSEG